MLSEKAIDEIVQKFGYIKCKKLVYKGVFSTDEVDHYCAMRFLKEGLGLVGYCGCGNFEIAQMSIAIWNKYAGTKLFFSKHFPINGGELHIFDKKNTYTTMGVVDINSSQKLEDLFRNIIYPLFSSLDTLAKLYDEVTSEESPIGLNCVNIHPVGVRAIQFILLAKKNGVQLQEIIFALQPIFPTIKKNYQINDDPEIFINRIWSMTQ